MLACYAGHLDVVKYLRRHGASWETRDLGGCTALHWAADGGHCDVIEWMIRDGCEVRVPASCTLAKRLESCPTGPARSGALSRAWECQRSFSSFSEGSRSRGEKGHRRTDMVVRLWVAAEVHLVV